ncbi:MAG TPA: hypothetical protein PK344_18050 [Syntrophorhabdaceae bacterium]|nr:hypothetical protein [Syntrophorhabdaceae bacterium]
MKNNDDKYQRELDYDIVNDLHTAKCRRCLREYREPGIFTAPIGQLGQILTGSVNNYYTDELCPDCIEQLSIFTLSWFKG